MMMSCCNRELKSSSYSAVSLWTLDVILHNNTINPYMTNGLSHPYHLDESILIFRGSGRFFHFHFIFR